MSKKRIIQITGIAFILLAVVLIIPNTDWSSNISVIGFISLICGTIGSIISIFIPNSFELVFEENDWTNELLGDYKLVISSRKHGLGNLPQFQTFMKNGKSYEEIGISNSVDSAGNVTIGANKAFQGKIILS